MCTKMCAPGDDNSADDNYTFLYFQAFLYDLEKVMCFHFFLLSKIFKLFNLNG